MTFRQRVELWFDAPWRLVPAEPFLFTTLWLAGVHVIATTGNAPLGFVEVGLSNTVYIWWNVLVLLAPVMVASAWTLVTFGRGRWMVFGFWLRLGGDVGILAALTALVSTRIALLAPQGISDSALFSLIVLSGFALLVAAMVGRDIGSLILLERLTHRLHRP